MKFLLDTCVVSELQRKRPNARVHAAVSALRASDLFLSVVTLGELTKGIALLSRGKKKTAIEDWLVALESECANRILPIDAETARIWGELSARAQKAGKPIPTADGLIAATAIRRGLQVMTRNTSDFRETRAVIVNPWDR